MWPSWPHFVHLRALLSESLGIMQSADLCASAHFTYLRARLQFILACPIPSDALILQVLDIGQVGGVAIAR